MSGVGAGRHRRAVARARARACSAARATSPFRERDARAARAADGADASGAGATARARSTRTLQQPAARAVFAALRLRACPASDAMDGTRRCCSRSSSPLVHGRDPRAGRHRRRRDCSRRATSPASRSSRRSFALPLVLPPTVLGYYLLVALGAAFAARALVRGARSATRWCSRSTACFVASVIFNLPFAIQPLQRAFEAIPDDLRHAASCCGLTSLAEPVADRAAARVDGPPLRGGADVRAHARRVRRRADGRRQHSRRDQDRSRIAIYDRVQGVRHGRRRA